MFGNFYLAGKEAMKNGPAAFNIAASEQYKNIGEEERKKLDDIIPEEREKVMTIKNIKREGAKLFQKIETQVFCKRKFGVISCISIQVL